MKIGTRNICKRWCVTRSDLNRLSTRLATVRGYHSVRPLTLGAEREMHVPALLRRVHLVVYLDSCAAFTLWYATCSCILFH